MSEVTVNDDMGIRGIVSVYTFDGDLPAEIVSDPLKLSAYLEGCEPSYVTRNMVSNVGRAQMTKLIVAETTATASYIGLTTSATTPSLTLTALTDELVRQAVSTRRSYNTYYQQYIAYFATTSFNSTGIAGAALNDTASTGGSQWAAASISLSKSNVQSATVAWLIQATS